MGSSFRCCLIPLVSDTAGDSERITARQKGSIDSVAIPTSSGPSPNLSQGRGEDAPGTDAPFT